jgi:hypothetical protein
VKSIKTLGLATAMALALIAFLGASAASATAFKSELVQTTWKGTRSGAAHELTLHETGFKCEDVSFTGQTKAKAVEEMKVSPELKKCKWSTAELNTSWAMNGCKFLLHAGGTVDIVDCNSSMSFRTYACTITIGNQTGIGTVQYSTEGTGEHRVIRAVANLEHIEYTQNGGGCPGQQSPYTDGQYKGEWLIEGGSGHPTFSSAEKSPEFPVSITGNQLGQQTITITGTEGEYPLACSEVALNGTLPANGVESLTIAPAYAGCQFLGLNVKVNMGGCAYVLHADGTLDIAGAKCASEPIKYGAPGCTVTIGPQSSQGFSSVSYSNEGSGKSASVRVGLALSGLTYTSSGAVCRKGTFSDGTYKGEVRLTAPSSGLSWAVVLIATTGVWFE